MTSIESGTRVKSGHYLSLRTWSIHPVARSGEQLPGRAGEKWIALPMVAALLLAPILGALFLMFLPVIGFWLAAVAASRPAMRLLHHVATKFAATVEPGWEPGLAHLTGKRAALDAAEPVRVEEDPLDVLEREIAARRGVRSAR